MTPLQAAKAHCDNYQSDGSCLGIRLRDDLSMYRFRKEGLPCLLCDGQRCPHFEEIMTPMRMSRETAEAKARADSKKKAVNSYLKTHNDGKHATILPDWIRAANERFARFSGSRFSPHELPFGPPCEDTAAVWHATTLCLKCRKREVKPPRQKYCPSCAKDRKRESNRRHMREKRGSDVGKFADSPLEAETLMNADQSSGYSNLAAVKKGLQPSDHNGHE